MLVYLAAVLDALWVVYLQIQIEWKCHYHGAGIARMLRIRTRFLETWL